MTDGPAIGVRFILEGKLDQIKGVLTDQNTTLETRLAAIEAAMRAQTLSLEDKLDLLEADGGSKFDLIVASLDTIKGQAEALGTYQTGIASKIAGVIDAINDLVDEVNSGNTSAAGHWT